MTDDQKPIRQEDEVRGNGGGAETIADRARQAREAIPVGQRGLEPQHYADQMVIARDRSKAYQMMPVHMHDNTALMAAFQAFAARVGLDPVMMAAHTYIPPGSQRLAFDAQLFMAILYASKLLIGRLEFDFDGDGDDMRCTCKGRFKENPEQMLALPGETYKQLHPGHVEKDGKRFVKGSQLWDDKPRQQMRYDIAKDWCRINAPHIVMGMFTPEEVMEMDEADRARRAIDVSGLAQRLETGRLDTGEGFVIPEAQVPAEEPDRTPSPRPARAEAAEPAREIKPPARPKAPAKAKTSQRPPARPQKAKPPKAQPPSPARIKAVADRAEARSTKAEPAKAAPPKAAPPKATPEAAGPTLTPKARAYIEATLEWIATVDVTDKEAAMAQWDAEWDDRDNAGLPVAERLRLKQKLDARFEKPEP